MRQRVSQKDLKVVLKLILTVDNSLGLLNNFNYYVGLAFFADYLLQPHLKDLVGLLRHDFLA